MKKVINKRSLSLIALGIPFLIPNTYAQEEELDSFELSPFEVDSSQDTGYRATSTLAGTRLRTDLKDIGTAISVVTEEFLDDTGATDNQSLLLYTLGTEVGGSQGNFVGGGDGGRVDTDNQRRNPNAANRVRGISAADNTRNFYSSDIPWDSYNVNRIDIQRGPNSVLFGLGSPSGVINAGLTTAIFSDEGSASINFGNDSTWRATFDYNKVVIKDQLAVRVSVLEAEKGFQQKEAFEEDSRKFISAQWTPDFLKTESSQGKLTANYEDGEIMANRPRSVPPIDRITPWFDSSNEDLYKRTFTSVELGEFASEPTGRGSEFIGNEVLGRIFDGPVAIYDGSGTPSNYIMADVGGVKYLGIDDASDAAIKAGLPYSGIGGIKSKTLTDTSIFDFYNHLIDGDNKSEWQDWKAYNITYNHTWMNDSLGIEVGLDSQEYNEGQTNILDGFGQSISVDIVSEFPDGTQNPNVGKAIVGGESQNNRLDSKDRDTFRVTGFYDYDFRNSGNESLAFLGRHLFTGLYSTQKIDTLETKWLRNTTDGINDGSSITQANRYLANIAYVSGDLSDRNSASGANIQPLQYRLIPETSGTITTSDGATPFDIISYDHGDRSSLYRQANKARDEIKSTALIWQSWLFDGLVVPMVAIRKDTVDSANAGNALGGTRSGSVDPFAPDWTLPGSKSEATNQNSFYESANDTTRTYSLVVHAPDAVTEALGGTKLSLSYTESENFRPDASRRDIRGGSIAPETGDTKDFGLTISALDDKLHFKINRYETKVKTATLSGSSVANSYMIGAGEGWGYMFARWAEAGLHDFSTNYALDADGNQINPNVDVLHYEPTAATPEAIETAWNTEQEALAAIFAPANRPSDDVFSFWGQDIDGITAEAGWGDGSKAWAGEPTTFAITSDFVSKGWEYELFYQPTKNWNIMMNAAKVDSRRLNIAQSYEDYVTERWALYRGPYGDVRLWNGGQYTETIRGKYKAEFYSNFLATALLSGAQVPEMRPWRANIITNYTFTEGKLNGLNVGGALRWQDEVIVGYAGTHATTDIPQYGILAGEEIYDTNKPYYGGAETSIDLWANYTVKLSDKVDWKIQLNISNVTAKDELIPITVNIDGTPATSRIAPQRTWTLANTLSF